MDVKYHCKSRSDNAPHIYSVADSAYQDVLHHEEPQHILLAGETLSGKTTLFKHLVKHLGYLGLVSKIYKHSNSHLVHWYFGEFYVENSSITMSDIIQF